MLSSAVHRLTVSLLNTDRSEPGFEIAQSMGIALLGLVVAAAFAGALELLGVEIINQIRSELGLGGG